MSKLLCFFSPVRLTSFQLFRCLLPISITVKSLQVTIATGSSSATFALDALHGSSLPSFLFPAYIFGMTIHGNSFLFKIYRSYSFIGLSHLHIVFTLTVLSKRSATRNFVRNLFYTIQLRINSRDTGGWPRFREVPQFDTGPETYSVSFSPRSNFYFHAYYRARTNVLLCFISRGFSPQIGRDLVFGTKL